MPGAVLQRFQHHFFTLPVLEERTRRLRTAPRSADQYARDAIGTAVCALDAENKGTLAWRVCQLSSNCLRLAPARSLLPPHATIDAPATDAAATTAAHLLTLLPLQTAAYATAVAVSPAEAAAAAAAAAAARLPLPLGTAMAPNTQLMLGSTKGNQSVMFVALCVETCTEVWQES